MHPVIITMITFVILWVLDLLMAMFLRSERTDFWLLLLLSIVVVYLV